MKELTKFMIFILLMTVWFSCDNAQQDKHTNSQAKNITLPKPDHIVILMEENHGYDQIIGSPHTPYINELAERGASFTDAHGIVHPSQPNYIGLFSGDLQGVTGDECLKDSVTFTTPNLGRALIDAEYSFTGYAQTMPHPGFTGCTYGRSELNGGYLYARKHCPWVNWQGDGENGLNGDSVSLPMSEFPSDFTQLPTVAMVVPDCDHDMHNYGGLPEMIKKGDQWVKDNLSDYIEWADTHNSLFILTFDEDNDTWENRIPTIFTGEMVRPGQYDDSISLYNILRTVEQMYKLPASGDVEAPAITSVWK